MFKFGSRGLSLLYPSLRLSTGNKATVPSAIRANGAMCGCHSFVSFPSRRQAYSTSPTAWNPIFSATSEDCAPENSQSNRLLWVFRARGIPSKSPRSCRTPWALLTIVASGSLPTTAFQSPSPDPAVPSGRNPVSLDVSTYQSERRGTCIISHTTTGSFLPRRGGQIYGSVL